MTTLDFDNDSMDPEGVFMFNEDPENFYNRNEGLPVEKDAEQRKKEIDAQAIFAALVVMYALTAALVILLIAVAIKIVMWIF